MSKISPDSFNALIAEELPSTADSGVYLRSIEPGKAEMVLPYSERLLRPGRIALDRYVDLLRESDHHGASRQHWLPRDKPQDGLKLNALAERSLSPLEPWRRGLRN